MTTAGDHNQTTPLHALATNTPGGKSLWTHELEARLLAGELDCIVHSLKDVPTTLVAGCVVRTAGPREESRDCVVMRASGQRQQEGGSSSEEGPVGAPRTLSDLPAGSVVGTSSIRRAAMIRRGWPGLEIADVRGNVGTRLAKLDDESRGYDALVLAGAGVQRLGLGHRASSWLSGAEDGVFAAVGQGALGVEFREGDEWVRGLVESVEEKRVRWACGAERGLLAELEGGCSVPVGVETTWEEDEDEDDKDKKQTPNTTTSASASASASASSTIPEKAYINLTALIVSPSGHEAVRASRRTWISSDAEADACGRELARKMVGMGAGRILEGINRDRDRLEAEKGKGGIEKKR